MGQVGFDLGNLLQGWGFGNRLRHRHQCLTDRCHQYLPVVSRLPFEVKEFSQQRMQLIDSGFLPLQQVQVAQLPSRWAESVKSQGAAGLLH